jgi:DTW domain-containing protein YfiP
VSANANAPDSVAFQPRAICQRCWRPESVCYCRHLPRIETRTKVLVLQHPRERDVPINTARIAALCLEGAELHVATSLANAPGLARALRDPERPAAVLFPGEGAIDLETNPPDHPVTLVVLDGTWWQANKLFRSNPELAALPRYSFRPNAPSHYRIRREPHDDYVSTLEALVHVLGVLENDPQRFLPMLMPFDAMVDTQLAYARGERGGPRQGTRHARPTRAPDYLPAHLRVFRERRADLVCLFAEANAWTYGSPERGDEEELVQWVAQRVETGESFSAFVAPRGALAPSTAFHLQVPVESILGGESSASFRERWASFVRPDDVFCTWGPQAARLFRANHTASASGAGHRFVDLRAVGRLSSAGRVGALADFARTHGAASADVVAPGRAGLRLGELVGIARAFVAKAVPAARPA